MEKLIIVGVAASVGAGIGQLAWSVSHLRGRKIAIHKPPLVGLGVGLLIGVVAALGGLTPVERLVIVGVAAAVGAGIGQLAWSVSHFRGGKIAIHKPALIGLASGALIGFLSALSYVAPLEDGPFSVWAPLACACDRTTSHCGSRALGSFEVVEGEIQADPHDLFAARAYLDWAASHELDDAQSALTDALARALESTEPAHLFGPAGNPDGGGRTRTFIKRCGDRSCAPGGEEKEMPAAGPVYWVRLVDGELVDWSHPEAPEFFRLHDEASEREWGEPIGRLLSRGASTR